MYNQNQMKPETRHWLEMSDSDHDTGLYLFKGAKHPQAVYFICQSIEKLLKAAIIEFADKAPQKIHRLENLAKESKIKFSQKQLKILTELSKHYSRVRYPDISQTSYNTKAKVMPIMESGKELYLWIRKKFASQ